MFDMGLHFRFLQKATEAFFEMSQASVAAALAVQSRVHEQMTSQTAAAGATDTREISNPLPWAASASGFASASNSGGPYPNPFAWSLMWATPLAPTWPLSPWAVYQGPMVATLVSYGVPYAVAAPAARASTSAMDAADAACAQLRLVFGNDNDSATPVVTIKRR
jgi:hypothetical protein